MRLADSTTDRVPADVEALVTLAREQLGALSPQQRARGERAIRLAHRQSRESPKRRALGLAAAVTSLALAVVFYLRAEWLSRPLQYEIENAVVAAEQVVPAHGSASPVLRFSDGTEVRLGPNAAVKIRFVTEHGATLALDEGYLHADVFHSSASEWRFDAGPYVVVVTGTSFAITWDSRRDRFDLKLERGSVTVRSPTSNRPIPVRAGQWLTIHSRSNELSIRDLTAEQDGIASVQAAQADAGTRDPVEAESNHPSRGIASAKPYIDRDGARTVAGDPAQRQREWVRDFDLGKLDLIVADARRRGIENCLASVSSEDLAVLADAARYTRHIDIARQALLALRRRFGGSKKATEAAFLLAKLDAAAHDDASALKYLNAYLSESPAGRYASEALGRKMAITQATRGPDGARPIALEYLSRYPNGAYAPAARAIVGGP
jgi:TolA-binding protein